MGTTALTLPAALTQDYRCCACHHLLFRGVLVGEIKCQKCGKMITLDLARNNRTLLGILLVDLQVVLQTTRGEQRAM